MPSPPASKSSRMASRAVSEGLSELGTQLRRRQAVVAPGKRRGRPERARRWRFAQRCQRRDRKLDALLQPVTVRSIVPDAIEVRWRTRRGSDSSGAAHFRSPVHRSYSPPIRGSGARSGRVQSAPLVPTASFRNRLVAQVTAARKACCPPPRPCFGRLRCRGACGRRDAAGRDAVGLRSCQPTAISTKRMSQCFRPACGLCRVASCKPFEAINPSEASDLSCQVSADQPSTLDIKSRSYGSWSW